MNIYRIIATLTLVFVIVEVLSIIFHSATNWDPYTISIISIVLTYITVKQILP